MSGTSVTGGPASDEEVPGYWAALGLPGLIDSHIHFLPDAMQRKVWTYFDNASTHYGSGWPVQYRLPVEQRLEILTALGVRAFPTLPYPHKPGMAAWLNDWSADFAQRDPRILRSATFFPEPEVESYVRTALEAGTRIFKVHIQVGGFDPRDPRLDPVWGQLADAGTPVVTHCGSRPLQGAHTGPGPIGEVLDRHPRLCLVIAHMGMHEYAAHLDLAAVHERVYLDTTMFATSFTDAFAPFDRALLPRLADLGDRILLGSDFPSIPYPYATQLAALHDLGLGEDWLQAVLWHNAAALFGISA
ncbi:MAG: amidohydrolase [Geodermatophilaceae bacterium]|nr:amidohydrolase [Geodermatophilaceae bacterium]